MSELRCPSCSSSVLEASPIAAEIDRSDVFACTTCEGFWLSREALVVLASRPLGGLLDKSREAVASTVSSEQPTVYRKCPKCHEHLNRRLYGIASGVIIDLCIEHGYWFDKGELVRVLRASPSDGVTPMLPRVPHGSPDAGFQVSRVGDGWVGGGSPGLRFDLVLRDLARYILGR